MIRSFHDKETETLFNGGAGHRSWQSFARIARRKLLMLDAAQSLHDLKNPPGNSLEQLRRDREGQHSIRINAQYRLCFVWHDGHAYDAEIVDYH